MTSGLPALRALVIYGLCVPLALMVGYFLGQPLDWNTIGFFGIVALVLGAPLILKWHYALLVAGINLSAVAFFLPGRPEFWMVLAGLSLSVSVMQLTLSRRSSFLHAPTVTIPLLVLLGVVLLTANRTGGIGFQAFGGQSIGGKRYINIFGAIVVYFALAARRIPLQKAFFFCALFFLSGVTAAIGSLAHFVTPGFYFIFWMFPPDMGFGGSSVDASESILRLGGLSFATIAVISFLLSRYGLRGTFRFDTPWRPFALFACLVLSLFGGFRLVLITILFYLFIQAYLEGFYKSRLTPVLAMVLVCAVAVGLPFVSKLPMTFQRALSVLPVNVSPEAREAARVSSEWRLQIWRDVLPDVPRYLLLGKGYAMNYEEWSQANASDALSNQGGTIVAGDYHNGPLSLIIPFGIWGVLAFLWVLLAGGRLLYCNFRYGDPALKNLNAFLLAVFVTRTIVFCFVFGGFHGDLVHFTALFGFSIALNGGKCRPAPAPAPELVPFKPRSALKPLPSFSR